MPDYWKKIILTSTAFSLILLGAAGLILPIIPGFVLVVAGALLADKVYPQLKHHHRIKPLLERVKRLLNKKF
jgi:uncharacterized protein YqgC (DUF456 family)